MESHPKPRIGLIAGSGQFPLLFIQGAKQAGYEVVAVGFEGETHPEVGHLADRFYLLKLGQLNRLIKAFKESGVDRIAMTGAINKTKLYARIRPDWRAFKLLNTLRHKKDDFLLRAVAEELESEGIRTEPSTLFLPSLLAPEGVFTRRRPTSAEQRDIDFGWDLAKAIGRLDIGQCLVVKDQAVLAVEGIDGTDATILRGGALCRKGAIVIKVSKPGQDLRFDVPAVGLKTIENMRAVRARVLVVEAGRTLMFDRDEMIKEADRAGITILARKPASDRDSESPDDSRSIFIAPSVTADPGETSGAPYMQTANLHTSRNNATKVGIIGVGYLGRFHAQKYARLPNANLVAVVDTDQSRAESVAQELGTRAYVDFHDILGEVEAVSIVTPTPTHFAIANMCLEAGIHVLLEKPMTETLDQAECLVNLAEAKGLVLQIGHLERFNPAYRAISPYIAQPMFVEVHRLALFNQRGLDVDVILDLMIHDIDIILHTMEAPLINIAASGVPVLTQLPDIANVRLDFANGATANLTASRISTKNLRRLRIFQKKCYLVADYGKRRAYTFRKESELDDAGYSEISVEEIDVEQRDALEDEIASFLDAIRTGSSPVVDGVQGLKALDIALQISRKIRSKIQSSTSTSRVP